MQEVGSISSGGSSSPSSSSDYATDLCSDASGDEEPAEAVQSKGSSPPALQVVCQAGQLFVLPVGQRGSPSTIIVSRQVSLMPSAQCDTLTVLCGFG